MFTEMGPATEIIVIRFYDHRSWPWSYHELFNAEVVHVGDSLSFPMRFRLYTVPGLALTGKLSSIGPGVLAFRRDYWPTYDRVLDLVDRESDSPPAGAELVFFPRSFDMTHGFTGPVEKRWTVGMLDTILTQSCGRFVRAVSRSQLAAEDKAMVFSQAIAVAQWHLDDSLADEAEAFGLGHTKSDMYRNIVGELEQAIRLAAD